MFIWQSWCRGRTTDPPPAVKHLLVLVGAEELTLQDALLKSLSWTVPTVCFQLLQRVPKKASLFNKNPKSGWAQSGQWLLSLLAGTCQRMLCFWLWDGGIRYRVMIQRCPPEDSAKWTTLCIYRKDGHCQHIQGHMLVMCRQRCVCAGSCFQPVGWHGPKDNLLTEWQKQMK